MDVARALAGWLEPAAFVALLLAVPWVIGWMAAWAGAR